MLQSKFSKAQDRQVIPFPDGWTWTTAPISIYRDSKGKITTDFNVQSHKPTGVNGYLSPTGSDANDGLTVDHPKKTITSLLGNANVDVVNYAAGVYPRQTISPATKNLTFVGATVGKTIFSASDNLSWALTSGKTYTYQASRTNVLDVVDLQHEDVTDQFREYTLVASIDEVEATAGTWYTVAGVVYVHTLDGLTPTDATIRALIDASSFILTTTTPYTFYFENILSLGGSASSAGIFISDQENIVYMYNVRSCYSGKATATVSNGFSFINAQTILQNCMSFKNKGDGFNYHNSGAGVPRAIEIYCEAWLNGDNAGNDNGSTIHDGGKIIRVNGKYYQNRGPNVADVSTGTESWNIGCIAHDSTCPAEENLGSLDYGFNSGNVKVWLDDCTGYGSTKTTIFGTTTDVVEAKTRNCKFAVTEEVGASSSLTDY